MPGTITAALQIIERSARTGQRAHLPPELSRALVAHPGFAAYSETRTKELVESWRAEQGVGDRPEMTMPAASSSGRSGYGIGASGMTGASAGTITEDQIESVGHAKGRRASAVVSEIGRHRKLRTR